MARSDLILEAQLRKLLEIHFFKHLIILLSDRILSHSPNFGRPKQGQKFVVPTFHLHFLNPECVRIPRVLAPKNFPAENFWVRSVLPKKNHSLRIKKNVAGWCALNFDVTDLQHS